MRISLRTQIFTLCVLYVILMTVCVVTSHPHTHRRTRSHNHYPQKNHVNHNHNRKHHWRQLEDSGLNAGSNDAYSESHHNSVIKPQPSHKRFQDKDKDDDLLFDYNDEDDTKEDEYEEEESLDVKSPVAAVPQSSSAGGGAGRHAYLMTNDHLPTTPAPDEDKTLNEAFIKHMQPTNQYFKNPHDVYAYKLPSDLWFIVRYKRNLENGQTEKYMNVVSSFTNYLDKLDDSAKSVSVNVKGVETVFRLTAKKPNT